MHNGGWNWVNCTLKIETVASTESSILYIVGLIFRYVLHCSYGLKFFFRFFASKMVEFVVLHVCMYVRILLLRLPFHSFWPKAACRPTKTLRQYGQGSAAAA